MRFRQWMTAITLALIVASLWAVYPPFDVRDSTGAMVTKGKINLGLDLQGGMHMKLEVDTTNLPPELKLGEAVDRALEILRNRIDALGVAEPIIQKEGEKWIVIQLPGIRDPERAVKVVGQTALLEFKLVDETQRLSDMTDASGNTIASKIPAGFEVLAGREGDLYVLKAEQLMTGAHLVDAKVQMDGYGRPIVAFKLDPEGGRRFGIMTGDNINRKLAIILDKKVYSAPVIKSRIGGGQGIIEGQFTLEDARDLALVLRAGALPVPVSIISKNVVGPTLGRDSIEKGRMAALVGIGLVILFMIIYYRNSGLVADIALVLNFLFLMAALAAMHATLTMPGIAGIILTIGMSVDANVLIYERIREELRGGKTVRASIDAGYAKAMSSIIDANVTTLITSAVLFQFGTGPIKGYAVTLTIGLLISMFTSIIVTKLIFEARKHYQTLSI